MNQIPITFEHEGKKYNGHFTQVAGGGSTGVWHLFDDRRYYKGCLRIGWQHQWYFDDSRADNKLEQLAQFFGDYVTAWIG